MPDLHKNFAYGTVATAPSPASSGTSLVVTAGQGALFPTPPFNATIWPVIAQPLLANAEIVRVTAIATDTLTIVRAQEGSSARTVVIGDQIAATITNKTLTDIEGSIGVPTNVTVDLGRARRSGTFDITGLSGLTVDKNVVIVQNGLPITSKGNARDEFEMDRIGLTGYVLDAATIRVLWNADNVVVGSYNFSYQVSA
jgi:hypothetical protein